MFYSTLATTLTSFLLLSSLVSGHGTIVEVTGANGVTALGFGVTADTPRDGSTRDPFQQDTSIIRDREIASGEVQACGKTDLGGVNDVDAQMAAAVAAGLPTAAADGTVQMTLHQVNQDGAGPYECEVDPTGTGESFQAMEVTTQVPGRDVPVVGSLSRATATPFPLEAQLPTGIECTGGGQNACLVRCRNTAIAGPFGSCAAVAPAGAAAVPNNAANPATLKTRDGREHLQQVARSFLADSRMRRSRAARALRRITA